MDPIGLVLAVPGVACALLLLVVLPGLSFGPLVAPGRPALLERLGRDTAAGLLATSLLAVGLGLLGLLRPTILIAGLLALAVLPLHGRRPGAPNLARLARRARLGGGFGVAALAVVGPALAAGPTGGLGTLPSAWSGAAAARAVADAGSLSTVGPVWAGDRLVAGTDIPGVAHLAATLQLLPVDIGPALAVDRIVLALLAAVVTATLLRRWVGGWAALVGGGLFVGIGSIATPLFDDPAAVRVLVLALFALWLADRAAVERSPRLAAATAVVGAVVLIARVDLFLALVAGIAGVGAARWLVAPGGGPENAGGLGHRHGRRLGLRLAPSASARAALASVAVAVVLSAGAGAGGARILDAILPSGDVLGAASGGDPGFVAIGEVPVGWQASGDEGWDFWRAAGPVSAAYPAPTAEPAPAVDPPSPSTAVRPPGAEALFATALAGGLLGGAPGAPPLVPLVVGLSLALPFASWPLLDQRRQRLVVAWAFFGLVLAGLAGAAVVRERAFLDLWAGVARVLPMQWLVGAAGVAFGSRLMATALSGAAKGRLPLPAARGSIVLALVASFVVGAGLVAGARATTERPGSLSATGAEAYAWISRRLPADARILANGRTTGVIATLGGRAGIVDGPEIDPADGALLARATGLALGARATLLEPATERAANFVGREGVSHLLVAGPNATASDLGAVALFPTDVDALFESPDYTLVRSFGERLWLFAVVRGR